MVELEFAQFRVVQEETAAEVVNRLLCLWQEFVGDEGYVVACLLSKEEVDDIGIDNFDNLNTLATPRAAKT